MRRPCEDMGLVRWSEQDKGYPRPIMVGNGPPQGVRESGDALVPQGSPGAGGKRALEELRAAGQSGHRPPEAWRGRSPGHSDSFLDLCPQQPALSRPSLSRGNRLETRGGREGEEVMVGRVWRQRSGWRREEGRSGRGRSPAQSPPRFPYLHMSFILALCLCYLR